MAAPNETPVRSACARTIAAQWWLSRSPANLTVPVLRFRYGRIERSFPVVLCCRWWVWQSSRAYAGRPQSGAMQDDCSLRFGRPRSRAVARERGRPRFGFISSLGTSLLR